MKPLQLPFTVESTDDLPKHKINLKDFYTAAEAAELLGLTVDTIKRACKAGVLPSIYLKTFNYFYISKKIIKDEASILNNPKKFWNSKQIKEELDIPDGIYHQYLRRGSLKPVAGKYLNYHWRFYRFKKEDVLELKAKRLARFSKNPDRFKYAPKKEFPKKTS